MKRSVIILFAAFLFSGCGGDKDNQQGDKREAKGPVEYGGVFRFNEVQDFRDLFPHSITEVTSHRIATQIYEGLVQFDQSNLKVIPAIAKDWEVNDDATQYTFHLREGVKFHDDPVFKNGEGREVTAQDFKYCFTKLCEASPRNQLFWLFKDKVKGANAYHASTQEGEPLEKGVEGLKVIDEHTFRIELKYPFSGFIKLLAHPGCWVYPKEAEKKYGKEMRTKCVGTGPFCVEDIKRGEVVILKRNPDYWAEDKYGNQLPYLDAVKVTFIKEKKTELLQFKQKNLDMIYRLPVDMIGEIAGKLEDAKKRESLPYKVQTNPSLSLQYYGFQHQSDLFGNKALRKAFNYAVDREKITTFTLQGEGIPANNGLVPPAFENYPHDIVDGYEFDPDKARDYMKKAGYPGGEGFPELTLQLNSGGNTNEQVAEAIQKMLEENLNIDLELKVMPWSQHLERVETGRSKFFRFGWVADYPDPENFLNLLYGEHVPDDPEANSYINSVRYKSGDFDSLFNKALREPDEKKRMRLFAKADSVAVKDAAIMPLFYDENIRLIQRKVKNFPMNSMEYRDLTRVYFKGADKGSADDSN